MSGIFPHLNKRVLTEADFWRIVLRERIRVRRCKLNGVRGYYCRDKKGKCFIVVDERLGEREALWVMFHELAHHFLHEPLHRLQPVFSSRRHVDTKSEREARSFAAMALLPEPELRRFEEGGGADFDGCEVSYDGAAVRYETIEYVRKIYQDRLDLKENYYR